MKSWRPPLQGRAPDPHSPRSLGRFHVRASSFKNKPQTFRKTQPSPLSDAPMYARAGVCADPCSAMQAYVPDLKGVDFDVAEPQLFPDVGLWHPLAPTMYEDLKEYLNWCAAQYAHFSFCEALALGHLQGMSHCVDGHNLLPTECSQWRVCPRQQHAGGLFSPLAPWTCLASTFIESHRLSMMTTHTQCMTHPLAGTTRGQTCGSRRTRP